MPFRIPGVRAAASACALVFLATLIAAVSPAALAQKPATGGVFTDKDGKTHVWSVTPSRALVWDGQPYVPVGGSFASHYLGEGQSDANWEKDAAGLATLKSKGVLDILLDPTVSAPNVPAAAWQRLIDHLDANGFRYGILFGAGITTPLTGTVVKPSRYRQDDIRDGQALAFRDADADQLRYYFVDAQDGTQVVSESPTPVRLRNGEVTIPPSDRFGNGTVALFFPHKRLKPAAQGGLADIWAGYDSYRDRVIAVLSKVKFGPGLRFFLDPLGHALNPVGEDTDNIVPDSAAFRLEWEAWLTQHHFTLDDLMNSWGVTERNIKSYSQAARMFPLAANNRGIAFMLDPDTGKRYETRGGGANFWQNLRDCRDASLSFYMNATANLLKREIADVPIIYTRTSNYRIFTNQERGGGFDGLGMPAYGRGSSLVTGGAESVISQADASSRPLWCLVTESADTAGPGKETLGIPSKQALFYDFDWLRNVGAKGFFVRGFQVLPEQEYPNYQILKAPDQLDWIKEYADRLNRGISVADVRPNTLLYPEAAAGYVRSGPIGASTVLWMPSLAEGKPLLWGNSYAGYTIKLPEGEQTVLWSLRGPRLTRLIVGDPRPVKIATPEGIPMETGKLDLKRKAVEIVVPATPIIVRGNENEVFPAEAAEDALGLLKGLVDQAETAKLPDAFSFHLKADRAVNMYKLKDPRMAYAMAADAINGIVPSLQPYTWQEAERADSHTFSEIVQNPAASGEAYLNLNATAKPGVAGYGAEFKFNVPADDSYNVWVACMPPGALTSPFAWLVDTDQAHLSSEASVVGSTYLGNQFVWMNLGRAYLKKGAHTYTLRVTEPAANGAYTFALDSVLITRSAFSPNGTTRPSLLDSVQVPTSKDKHDLFDFKPKPPTDGTKSKKGKQ
jgi:hypothetical protein